MSALKEVKFDDIEFFEFPYILGNNPAVSSGAPLAIGDDLLDTYKVGVDHYESNRSKRKSRKKLVLPVTTRAQILLGQGYSLESIANATMEADAIGRERIVSANKQHMDRINEVSERFSRVFKKALGNKATPQPMQSMVASSSA